MGEKREGSGEQRTKNMLLQNENYAAHHVRQTNFSLNLAWNG